MTLSTVGPYRLLRLLKTGGEGAVYVAEDTRLGRRVAVKVKPLPEDSGRREQAIAEARALAALNDPMIVQIYDVLELAQHLAVVMEYVDGEDLESLITRERLSLPSTLALGQDICDALAATHEAGLRHGDLKPANILVTPEARIKLADVGGSGVSPSATSPEQRTAGVADARSDLFALGCVLHAALLGPVPEAVMTGSDTQGLLAMSSLPGPLAKLLESLLQGDPERRPATAMAVRLELLMLSRAYPSGYADLLSVVERGDSSEAAVQAVSGPEQAAQRRLTATRQAVPWLVVLVGCLAAVVLVLREPDPLRLRLETVRWQGERSPLLEDVDKIFASVVAAAPHVSVVAGQASQASLTLSVQCNAYSCVSTLALNEDGAVVSDTRALLPDSDVQAWRQRLRQGVSMVLAQR